MSSAAYLKLNIDGIDIDGDSSVHSMERENSIECRSISWKFESLYDPGVRQPSRGRSAPLTITKLVDRSSPLLAKALLRHEPVTRAEFRFFRPNPKGDGTEEQYYTVLLEDSHLLEIGQVSDEAIVSNANTPLALEEVSFLVKTVTLTYEPDGVEHVHRFA